MRIYISHLFIFITIILLNIITFNRIKTTLYYKPFIICIILAFIASFYSFIVLPDLLHQEESDFDDYYYVSKPLNRELYNTIANILGISVLMQIVITFTIQLYYLNNNKSSLIQKIITSSLGLILAYFAFLIWVFSSILSSIR